MAGVPGSSFFREPEHRFIRFHFAKKEETLRAAGEVTINPDPERHGAGDMGVYWPHRSSCPGAIVGTVEFTASWKRPKPADRGPSGSANGKIGDCVV